MEFRILGPLEVVAERRPVAVGAAKQRTLLAVLLLDANRPVSTDRLVDTLWGETPPATAQHTIQVYVSQLRKVVGAALETKAPGYLIRVGPDELDLSRFERLAEHGRRELAAGDADAAARSLADALALWRGPALADFLFETWAQGPAARLEDLRLATLEERIEADLVRGRHAELVAELEQLVADNPLRERPRGQLMLALYRSGRQAEALATYQEARTTLVEELGIEPGPALQRLERAILTQDESLDMRRPAPVAPPREAQGPRRSILVAAPNDATLAIAASLAQSVVPHELVLASVVREGDDVTAAAAELNQRRAALLDANVPARSAAFTSADAASDLLRLASQQDVDLLLLPWHGSDADAFVRGVLADAPSDVALVRGGTAGDGGVVVLFGGAEHDWAALEVAAWLARSRDRTVRLLGTEATDDRRDASRLLATAALAVQQLAGVPAEPVLAGRVEEAVGACVGAAALVFGLPERWRTRWLGETRGEIVAGFSGPTLLVRRGIRPGGLSPPEGLTRYTWSLSPAGA